MTYDDHDLALTLPLTLVPTLTLTLIVGFVLI